MNNSTNNYPEAPEGYVCLGFGKSFAIIGDDFEAITCYSEGDPHEREPYLCNGQSKDLIYYVRADSEMAKLNEFLIMETKQEQIKVGDKVVKFGQPRTLINTIIYTVVAIDGEYMWIRQPDDEWGNKDDGFVTQICLYFKYQEEIKVGSTVQFTTATGKGRLDNDRGKVLYIHGSHALVLYDNKKVPEMKRIEDLEVI